jgi:alanine-glyoxylate transaminase / serine-glyoxylate transaminase / serine-pyruvate transaminase
VTFYDILLLIIRQVVLDGVCSVASEEIRFDDWDIDVVLSATQKGLGTPPGLSVVMASPRAIKVYLMFAPMFFGSTVVRIGLPESIDASNFVLCQLAQVCIYSTGYFLLCLLTLYARWLPIMQAYEEGRASYFATPPVNLIYAFHASLKQIVEGTPSLEDRFRLHRETSQRIKNAIKDLGLRQVRDLAP